MTFHYKLENNKYCFYEDEKLIFESDEIGIYFHSDYNDEMWMLLKHGRPYLIDAAAQRARKKFKDAGYEDMLSCIHTISGKWDIEKLNDLINITGILVNFLEAHHIDSSLFKPKVHNRIDSVSRLKLRSEAEMIHATQHNKFSFWGTCDLEPCASTRSKLEKLEITDGSGAPM